MTPLSEASSERLYEAWDALCAPIDRYSVDAELIRQNLLDHPLLHGLASSWNGRSFLAIKRSAAALYKGPDPKVAHLSLVGGRIEDLSALFDGAKRTLQQEGYEAIVVGMDSGHFLPGAPVDLEPFCNWLMEEGFAPGSLAYDLERDLQDYSVPSALPSGEYRRLQIADVEGLERFLQREFPGRWRYDVRRKIEAEGIGTVFGLFLAGQCEGFALLQDEKAHLPIGGAVWQKDLGPRWGSLGPIGISKDTRGQGYGNALLARSLEELHRSRIHRTIIDWTTLVDFYGAHGFEVARTYRAYRLTLDRQA